MNTDRSRVIGTLLIVMLLMGIAWVLATPAAASIAVAQQTANPISSVTFRTHVATKTATSTTSSPKLSPELQAEFNSDPNSMKRYLVMLTEQADTTNNITDWDEKGWYVYNKLKGVADRTQPLVADILARQETLGHVSTYRSYVIINAFGVEGNLSSANMLASLPEIGSIDTFPIVSLTGESQESAESMDGATGTPSPTPTCSVPRCRQGAPTEVQWNVDLLNAQTAWNMGYNGANITVGSIDSGAFYTHESIESKYRGTLTGSHDYNWYDPVQGQLQPYDSNILGHGTHTIGTILGANGIGVAPGANWIAARLPQYEDQDIFMAMDFMLAPWRLNGLDRDLRKELM